MDRHGGARLNVDHVVLLRIREDITPEEFGKLVEGANQLNYIPGVLSVKLERTLSEPWMGESDEPGYTHALRVRLSSKNALRGYQNHPIHVGINDHCIKSVTEGRPLSMDFEVEPEEVDRQLIQTIPITEDNIECFWCLFGFPLFENWPRTLERKL